MTFIKLKKKLIGSFGFTVVSNDFIDLIQQPKNGKNYPSNEDVIIREQDDFCR